MRLLGENMFKSFLLIISILITVNATFLRNDNDNTIIDTKTNLIWLDDSSEAITWSDAIKKCEDNEDGVLKGWRLPNYNEVYSLINIKKYNPAISSKFKSLSSTNDYFWTSTIINNGFSARVINLNTGGDSSLPISLTQKLSFMCVHTLD